jgi:DNA polymerase-3 subunit gamma/tau
VIAFGPNEPFVAEVAREAALVERLASEHFGTPTTLTLERDSTRAAGVATIATLDAEEAEQKRRAALAKVKNHPRVTEALEVLGARVKDLKLAGQ